MEKPERTVRVVPALTFTSNLLKVPKNLLNKVYRCEKCRRYQSQSILFIRNHVRRHHSTLQPFDCKKNENYYCGDCNISIEHLVDFREHLKNCHSSIKKKSKDYYATNHKCQNCSFHSYSLLILIKHKVECDHLQKIIENDQKKVSCMYCDFKCTDRKVLRTEHICDIESFVNKKEGNWFECAYCCHRTKDKRDCKLHILRRHISDHKINWLKCDHCDYKFKVRRDLKNHIEKIHSKRGRSRYHRTRRQRLQHKK